MEIKKKVKFLKGFVKLLQAKPHLFSQLFNSTAFNFYIHQYISYDEYFLLCSLDGYRVVCFECVDDCCAWLDSKIITYENLKS